MWIHVKAYVRKYKYELVDRFLFYLILMLYYIAGLITENLRTDLK